MATFVYPLNWTDQEPKPPKMSTGDIRPARSSQKARWETAHSQHLSKKSKNLPQHPNLEQSRNTDKSKKPSLDTRLHGRRKFNRWRHIAGESVEVAYRRIKIHNNFRHK
jgi:hypothetical protein